MSKPAVEDRFVTLLEEHKRILYKVASAYCRNPADRPDLLGNVVAVQGFEPRTQRI